MTDLLLRIDLVKRVKAAVDAGELTPEEGERKLKELPEAMHGDVRKTMLREKKAPRTDETKDSGATGAVRRR